MKRDFSLKMRKVNEKYARVKKYKLKTKKAFQKRFRIVSLLSFNPLIVRRPSKQDVQVPSLRLSPLEPKQDQQKP